MQRRPEAELMEDAAQALAYAAADFSEPHNRFIELFRQSFPGFEPSGDVLDLGCGPGDITLRYASAFPRCRLHGIDGAAAMIKLGLAALKDTDLEQRVRLIHGYLPTDALPLMHYDVIISNSLLHHLADPQVLWRSIRQYGRPGAAVFVMDLLRPVDEHRAAELVAQYAAGEAEILRHDFFNSLCAAYRPDEVATQLQAAGLNLSIEVVSDRHLIVHGRLP